MSYAKPAIHAIDHQTELAGCNPCDGSAAAQLFVRAGLGEVYSRFFGPPCPAPPLVGPVDFCVVVGRQYVCGHVDPNEIVSIPPGVAVPAGLP